MPSNLKAKIYSWTDEDGKKHYSNVAPPENLKNVKDFKELSIDDAKPENQNKGTEPKKKTQKKRRKRKTRVNTKTKVNKKVKQQSPTTRGTGLLKTVNDPATVNAIKAFNKKKQEIGLKCKQEMAMKGLSDELKCMCKHLAEIIKANQAKIDAFLDLMNRRPELANQMVEIEGVFGNWYLDPNDPEMKNRNNVQFFKRRYNCR